MDKNHGRTTGIYTNRVGYRAGDDVGGKHRREVLIEPLRETASVKLVNRALALVVIYLAGHIIYVLWSEL